jgi:hypothetical protein
MKKTARIILAVTLLAAMPSTAMASYPPQWNGKCLFIFPVSWAAYMYIPCQAGALR